MHACPFKGIARLLTYDGLMHMMIMLCLVYACTWYTHQLNMHLNSVIASSLVTMYGIPDLSSNHQLPCTLLLLLVVMGYCSYTHLNSARVKKTNQSLADVLLSGYQSLSNDEGHTTPQFREPLLQDMSYGSTSW